LQPTERIYHIFALVCAALAVVPGYYALTLRWAPHADFDVTGLLWILQNFPRLLACFLTLALACAALYFVARAAADV
jgi:hypothetical protein